MKFPGYWVSMDAGKVVLQKSTFDDTELDPATQWKQAWQNQDEKGQAKGFVELSDALGSAATLLAGAAGRALTQTELAQVGRYEPVWQSDRCEIPSLAQFLGSTVS